MPIPTDAVTVKNGTDIIWYQWYLSQNLLDVIGLNKWGKDPLDDNFYSVYLLEDRSHFQLLWFLEEENTDYSAWIHSTVSAVDYTERYPFIIWDSLGIMVWTGNDEKVPIQDLSEIMVTDNWILDLATTTSEYSAFIESDYIVTGDNTKLWVVASMGKAEDS